MINGLVAVVTRLARRRKNRNSGDGSIYPEKHLHLGGLGQMESRRVETGSKGGSETVVQIHQSPSRLKTYLDSRYSKKLDAVGLKKCHVAA